MRLLLAVAFAVLFYSGFSQELIFNSTPKKGIYKNFYEFKYNRPSIELEYIIIAKPIQTMHELDTFYQLNAEKKDTTLPRDIFGFCDGSDIYLNLNRGAHIYRSIFSKLEFIGRFCVFRSITITGATLYTHTSDYFVTEILDAIDGDQFPITATIVDDMIKDDLELLKLFQDENRKERVAIDYIIQYCERNLSRHVIFPIINDSTICKLESDSSYEAYYQRIVDFRIDTTIFDVELRKYYYGKKKLKMIGLKAKHKRGKNEDYYYQMGTWKYYHRNGNLKDVVNYDCREKKNGKSQHYDIEGNLVEEKTFKHGIEVE